MKSFSIVLTVVWSAALAGARRHTCWKTLTTWQLANASVFSSSWPREAAPTPLPGRLVSQPRSAFGPERQRFDQLSSGVTTPQGKFCGFFRYFACTCPGVYTSWLVVVLKS